MMICLKRGGVLGEAGCTYTEEVRHRERPVFQGYCVYLSVYVCICMQRRVRQSMRGFCLTTG